MEIWAGGSKLENEEHLPIINKWRGIQREFRELYVKPARTALDSLCQSQEHCLRTQVEALVTIMTKTTDWALTLSLMLYRLLCTHSPWPFWQHSKEAVTTLPFYKWEKETFHKGELAEVRQTYVTGTLDDTIMISHMAVPLRLFVCLLSLCRLSYCSVVLSAEQPPSHLKTCASLHHLIRAYHVPLPVSYLPSPQGRVCKHFAMHPTAKEKMIHLEDRQLKSEV